MKVFGLDLSLLGTAICIYDVNTGTYSTQMVRGDKASTEEAKIKRLHNVSSKLLEIIEKESFGDEISVIIEAPAKNQQWQAANVGEMHGVVKIDLFRKLNIIPWVEQATKLRKEVVGKIERKTETVTGKNGKEKKAVSYGKILGKNGKLKKATIKDIVQARLKEQGFEFETQDEMDAFVCARWLVNKLKGESDERT